MLDHISMCGGVCIYKEITIISEQCVRWITYVCVEVYVYKMK